MRRNYTGTKGLMGRAALEGENDNDDEVAAAPAADSLETDMVEIAADEGEQAETEAETTEAVETVEAMESLIDSLRATAANGGLDKGGADILMISCEHMYQRVGLIEKGNKLKSVSMESFGGATSRMGATQVAMEDIKSKVAEIWKHIIDAIKKAIAWVKEHISKYFGAAEKMQKRAKALQERAEGITGTAKEKTFENERLVKELSVKGVVPTNLSKNLEEVTTVAKEVFGSVTAIAAKCGESMLETLNDAEKFDLAQVQVAPMQMPSQIGAVISNPQEAGFGTPTKGLEFLRTSELPGNKALIMRVPSTSASGEEAAEIRAKMGGNMGAWNPKAKAPTKTTVQTLAATEAGALAEVVGKLAAEVIAYKANVDKATAMKEKIVKAAEAVGKAAGKEEDEGKKKALQAAQKMTMNAVNFLDKPTLPFVSYALNVGKASLDYAELSLKQYDK